MSIADLVEDILEGDGKLDPDFWLENMVPLPIDSVDDEDQCLAPSL